MIRSFATGSDDQRKLVVIIADTLIRGVSVPASEEEIEVDAADAATLIMYSKATPFTARNVPSPDELAAVAAHARAELIAKIAGAISVEELEELLSEDPEIVAAYEKRLVEIEAFEASEVAKANLLEQIAQASSLDILATLVPPNETDGDVLAAVEKRKGELAPQ